MKICLVGEFSNVHRYLRDGVRELGYAATTASHGDFFKAIPADILMAPTTPGLASRLRAYVWLPLRNAPQMTGYDVIQFINPQCFAPHLHFNSILMTYLRYRNKRAFVIASGEDARYWKHYADFRYNPVDDYLKFDAPGRKIKWKRWDWIAWSEHVFRTADGIIPLGYEFGLSYEREKNCRKPIPLPVNLAEASFSELTPRGKIVFFHGLNRLGHKGTRYIDAAMAKLTAKYPNDVTYVRAGNMPFFEYQKLLASAHVVVDQTSMYHYGMNAAIAMAMGKVVLSGAEPEAMKWHGFLEPPVMNITPDPEQIFQTASLLLEDRTALVVRGAAGRAFAEKYHDHVKVASRFLAEWQS
jgi:hypothetical protein